MSRTHGSDYEAGVGGAHASALLDSRPVPADSVFKSACSYIEALAASSVASAVFFQSPIACQLVQVLRSTGTDGSERVIAVLRALLELARRGTCEDIA